MRDALETGQHPRLILVSEEHPRLVDELPATSVRPLMVDPQVFNDVAETVTPAGLLAVFPLPELVESDHFEPLALVIAGVRDPGNVGTLIRSAAGAGATSVWLLPGSADPYNSKAVRAGMGGHFRVPIATVTNEEASERLAPYEQIILADETASKTYDEVDFTIPTAIVIGSEATGPDAFAQALATDRVAIPLERNLESLNAGISGAVILFEASRQRRIRGNEAKSTQKC